MANPAQRLSLASERAREPVSFWRENKIAVVILQGVFVRTAKCRKRVLET